MNNMPIKMNIYGRIFAHNGTNRHEIFIHPVKVFLLIPDVAIHFLFKGFQLIIFQFLLGLLNGFCYERITTDIYLLRIIGSTCEGWVDVD